MWEAIAGGLAILGTIASFILKWYLKRERLKKEAKDRFEEGIEKSKNVREKKSKDIRESNESIDKIDEAFDKWKNTKP